MGSLGFEPRFAAPKAARIPLPHEPTSLDMSHSLELLGCSPLSSDFLSMYFLSTL